MLLTIVQPSYFPPLAHFAKALCADVVIHADTFQFRKHDFVHRMAIKTVSGARWLSLPLLSKGHLHKQIREMEIDARQPWRETHVRSLAYNYHNAAYYYYYADGLERLLNNAGNNLGHLLTTVNSFLMEQLAPGMHLVLSHDLPAIAERTQRLAAWLKALGCNRYLIWPHEIPLVDMDRLADRGVQICTFTYQDRPYHQQFGAYVPGLSVLDLLLNEGPAATEWLRDGARIQAL